MNLISGLIVLGFSLFFLVLLAVIIVRLATDTNGDRAGHPRNDKIAMGCETPVSTYSVLDTHHESHRAA